ncbi:MAG: hypothetical protein EOP84_21645 [Verrucomicrobiaceae bacterium]|nr:MAG: hypothetical protein EOP84_21645 [Verrucomicrobiaceae bacterium]
MSIRRFIKLVEAPYQLDQDDYNDDMTSTKDAATLRYNQFMRYPHEVLEQNSRYMLARSVFDDAGEYMLISQPGNRVSYYNSYEVNHIPGLGVTATQKDVWANKPNYPHIAQHVFMTYMLDAFDTLVADTEQTPDGRKFWVRCMTEAVNNGLTVGILDTGRGTFAIYTDEEGQTFPEWLQKNWAWGKDAAFEALLPFISNHNHH